MRIATDLRKLPEHCNYMDFYRLLDDDGHLGVSLDCYHNLECPVFDHVHNEVHANPCIKTKDKEVSILEFLNTIYQNKIPSKFNEFLNEKESTMKTKSYKCTNLTNKQRAALCQLIAANHKCWPSVKKVNESNVASELCLGSDFRFTYCQSDKLVAVSGRVFTSDILLTFTEMIDLILSDDPFGVNGIYINGDKVVFNDDGSIKVGCTSIYKDTIEKIIKEYRRVNH